MTGATRTSSRLRAATTYDGEPKAVPIITAQEVLYYRKDLLEKAGYDARPKTLDELKKMAAKIEQENDGVAGFVARTAKAAAVTQFSSFLYSFGGDFTDGSGKATVNTEAAKQAYAFNGGLINEHGPDNVGPRARRDADPRTLADQPDPRDVQPRRPRAGDRCSGAHG